MPEGWLAQTLVMTKLRSRLQVTYTCMMMERSTIMPQQPILLRWNCQQIMTTPRTSMTMTNYQYQRK